MQENLDHAELVTHAFQGMPRAEQVVCADQGVPLIVQQVNQLIKLRGREPVQAGPA